MQDRIQYLIARLWHDEAGFIMSAEAVLVVTIVVIGGIVGLAATRDSVVSELSDVGGAMQDINQTYSYSGISSHWGRSNGSRYNDSRDFCDDPEDTVGQADNCISFDIGPSDEGDAPPAAWEPEEDPKTVRLSEVGSFNGTSSTTSTADGTIGGGGINTNFSVSTTGDIIGFSGNRVRFREGEVNAGTYTIDFDDPITNAEFWIGNFTNTEDDHNNLLGNFKVTLSDGTVMSNAQFSILPDAIAPNSTFGEFTTVGSTSELVTMVNQAGTTYVTDPAVNGGGTQGGGRLIFTDVPTLDGSFDCLGITSIMFDMTGGPDGYSAFFSMSGQVIDVSP